MNKSQSLSAEQLEGRKILSLRECNSPQEQLGTYDTSEQDPTLYHFNSYTPTPNVAGASLLLCVVHHTPSNLPLEYKPLPRQPPVFRGNMKVCNEELLVKGIIRARCRRISGHKGQHETPLPDGSILKWGN